MTSGKLFDILEWAKTEGEVKAIDRIRLKVLPVTVKEGIVLAKVSPDTACSPACLAAVRKAAIYVVGKSCPF